MWHGWHRGLGAVFACVCLLQWVKCADSDHQWQELLDTIRDNRTEKDATYAGDNEEVNKDDDYVTLDHLFEDDAEGWNKTDELKLQDEAFVFNVQELDRETAWNALLAGRTGRVGREETTKQSHDALPTMEALPLVLEQEQQQKHDEQQEDQADDEAVRGASLVFIFDSTGSMHNELNQVKVGASQILQALSHDPSIPIHNYVLIPFHDPSIGPVTVTRDREVFKEKIEEISVAGGGDCPEMSVTAIKKALEVSLPGSYIYVFTDASAKDYKLENEVLSLIQRRGARVDFIMTDDCSDQEKNSYQVYNRIAETSSGQVYRLSKNEVKEVLKYVKVALHKNVVNLLSKTKPAPQENTPDEHEVMIDETLKEFTVSVSGVNASIIVTDPKGKSLEGPPELEPLLTLTNVKIVNVKEPEPGPWKVHINSNSNYTVRSTGLSDVHFNHGFSTIETNNLMETNHRPLTGATCYVLIQTSDLEKIHNLTSVDVVGLNGEIIQKLPLEAVPGKPGTFKGGGFIPPSTFFHLGMTGFGKDGFPIKRITTTAISSQLPEKPVITMRPRTSARINKAGLLKCHVQSVVPFKVQWFKDGHLFGDEQTYSQTCEVLLEIKVMALHSQGNYTCRAVNAAGVGLRSTFLSITGEPPVVQVANRLTAVIGEQILLDCSVSSELEYSAEWKQFTAKNEQTGVIHKVTKGDQLKNNTLVIESVGPHDEGWYLCVATNKGGKGEGRLFLLVTDPVKVTVVPTSLRFEEGDSARVVCAAAGRPAPQVEWRRGHVTIGNEDPTMTVQDTNGNLTLVFGHLYREQAGSYSCIAANSEETVTASAELIYMERPVITAKANNIMVKVGTGVVLTCSTTGVPKPEIKWYRGGSEITPSYRIQPSEGTLKIQSVRASDADEYSCEASNSAGQHVDYIGLLVGSAPTFLLKPKNKKIQIHHNATIPCSAIGVPPAEVTWHRKPSGVLITDRMSVSPGGALRITNMQINDTGFYVCSAQNIFGQDSSEVLIEVTGLEKPFVDKNILLEEVKSMAGDTVTIPCGVVLGNPPGVVTWYKDRQHLINSSTTAVLSATGKVSIDSSGSLVIRDVTPGQDKGSYLCSATNVAGNTSRPYKLTITESPKIISSSSGNNRTDLKAVEGGEIVIPCPIGGEPTPSITWMKNGLPIPTSPTVFQHSDGSLIIRNLTVENSGKYVCTAVNSVGSASKATAVHIQVPPSIVGDPGDDTLNIVEGHVVVLNCRVAAVPTPSVQWFKQNKSLLMGENIGHSQPQVLRFIANTEDSGIYKCVAVNEAGTASKDFNVTILVPPSIVDREDEISVKAKAGLPISLQCNVVGFPRPTVLWQRNGIYLTHNSSDVTIMDSGLLMIHNVSKDSAGAYICDAENMAGITQRIYYLQVNFPPKIVDEVNVSAPIQVKEGEEYSLPCLVEGNPRPTVTWHRNGFPVHDSTADLVILGDNTLVFLQVTRETSGQYRCQAVNAEGSVYKDYNIEVYSPPLMQGADDLVRFEVNEGDSIVLTCPTSISSPPPHIQWIKDGKPLNSLLQERADEVQMKLSEDQRLLTIVEAHPNDNGNFSCVATNLAGRTDAKFLVDVLMTPHFEEFNHIAHRTILAGGEITLNCSVSGNPQPKVSWRKDSVPINSHNSPGVHITLDRQHLVIGSGRVHHSGTYTCTATNKVNTKEREFYIRVIESPSISGPSEETVDVMAGQKLTLFCAVKGVPEPEITWRKIGKDIQLLNTTTNTFEVEQADCDNEGTYTCQVVNPAGIKTKTFHVTVLEPPMIEGHDVTEHFNVPVGGNLTLRCKTKGQPKPDITWLHNGHIISFGADSDADYGATRSRRQLPADMQLTSLTLSNITEFSKGVYTVLASNKAGVMEKTFQVQVVVPPTLRDDLDLVDTLTVLQPLPIHMMCPVYGDPKPNITWFFNNNNNNKLHLHQDLVLEGERLYIKRSNLDMTGTYTCHAENAAGNITHTFNLTVIQPPLLEGNITSMLSVVVTEELRLQCNATGSPDLSYHWLKLSDPLTNDSRIEILEGGKSLVISTVEMEDAGVYICIASNIGGAVEKKFSVRVYEPPILSDQSVVDLPHKKVFLHRSFSLQCAFEGHPMPKISWYKDGQPVFDTSRLHLHSNGVFLTALNATPDDIGDYKCVAENVAGVQDLTFRVDVSVAAVWTEWKDWSACSTSCGTGQRTRVRSCEVEHKPSDPRVLVDNSGCVGTEIEKTECFTQCQVHGGWGGWSNWTSCSLSCGEGTKKRYRLCDNPEPRNHGQPCLGADNEEEMCLAPPCPIDGQWSNWSEWSGCINNCGGSRQRSRKCSNPEPSFGGVACTGPAVETALCKCTGRPNGHSKWLPWSEWTPCSASCGRGHRKRHRICRPTKKGVKSCKGDNLQIKKCFVRSCRSEPLPKAASLHIRGQVNGELIDNHIAAEIANVRNQRLVTADVGDLRNHQNEWFPYTPFLLSPVSWSTAYESEDADNGYSLTSGRFFSQSEIEFVTGEGLRVSHEGQGVDEDGKLWVQIEVAGEVPLVQPHATVNINSIDQDFVQTGTNSLYSVMQNDEMPFSWNSSIHYDNHRGTMPYLVETLSMNNIQNDTPWTSNYTVASSIRKKFEDNKCPPGFQYDARHLHCQDVDECMTERLSCGVTETCRNTLGSYTCECRHGFAEEPTGGCDDVNECLQHPPVCSHVCHNTVGSFTCSCPRGFYLSEDATTCLEHTYDSDYDEYQEENFELDSRTQGEGLTQQLQQSQRNSTSLERLTTRLDDKVHHPGHHHRGKLCMAGFYFHKFLCKDYDECSDDPHICDDDEICLNTPGSYQCLSTPCPVGFDRVYPSRNCMRHCESDISHCASAAISETVTFHAVSLDSLTPLQDILYLDVMAESGVLIRRTRFKIRESGELFRVRVIKNRGSLYALRALRRDTLYRVVAEALSYGQEDRHLYTTEFVIYILLVQSN